MGSEMCIRDRGSKNVEVSPINGVTIVDVKPSKVIVAEKPKTPTVRITANGLKSAGR